jgi:hypothetical protein
LPAARNPEIAARRFIETLASATSCVAPQRLATVSTYFTPEQEHIIRFPSPPVALRASSGGPRGLLIDVSHVFGIEESPEQGPFRRRWRVTTRMYQYRLFDRDDRELLVYHWQPGDAFLGPDHPHVHVSAALFAQVTAVETETIDLTSRHLVTSRISLEGFVRMLIEEFDAAPQRADWRETLDRTEAAYWEEITRRA